MPIEMLVTFVVETVIYAVYLGSSEEGLLRGLRRANGMAFFRSMMSDVGINGD